MERWIRDECIQKTNSLDEKGRRHLPPRGVAPAVFP